MAFIGAGKMAEAIIGGLPPVNWDNTQACDFNEGRARVFRERFGIKVVPNGAAVVKDADVVSVQKAAYDRGHGLGAADTCDFCCDASSCVRSRPQHSRIRAVGAAAAAATGTCR
jgi:hypothetical protein